MAIVKVIEVIAGSEKSFDDATRNALAEAAKSVKNIKSIYIKEMNVTDNKIVSFGVNAKVSFEVDSLDTANNNT
ncbi:dodecin family protein [Pontibacter toksunensis]|uniref:Dodecin family protein n=1 Tax=Pontibacter toksunensis TaxID=1332631 RepID=A0ABW6BZ52_9BACT